MIYIFDDKKNRQEGYGWIKKKFEYFKESVITVYQYNEVENIEDRKKLFSEGNTILFHESFFDAHFNRHHKEAIIIRRELEEFANKNPNFYLVFFSGSKSTRFLKNNVAYLPVSILYQNLDEFIQKSKTGSIELKYLLYGKNPNIEVNLVEKLRGANASLLNFAVPFAIANGENILIATTNNNERLPQIVTGASYEMILNGDSDVDIHEVIIACLIAKKYDKIFIPLCFGTSLSDFNGLKLAIHIRCTDTINRCTPLYIYSFVKIDELINHEYFNVLKQKSVQLIDYSIKAFEDVIKVELEPLEYTELPKEMSKLKLEVPKDYEDSHSIANEWAVYRWAKAINAEENTFMKTIEKVTTLLYFKYLNTIYPSSEIPIFGEEELKIKTQNQPKILYVDDDAEKGWSEILCKLLSDINNIEKFDYLGDEIKLLSQQEIIDKTICKITVEEIDLVILDFRLHPDDFLIENIKDVTGLKLLKAIKKINPGIQVIIFSATNKVWNLLELQSNGADGFLLKESPELTMISTSTYESIRSLSNQIEKCLLNTYLKETWNIITEIKNIFSKNPLARYYPNDLRALRGMQYQNLLLFELDSIYNILSSQNENRFNYAMLIEFKILECLVEIFIPEKNRDGFWLFFDGSKMEYFYTEDNKLHGRNELLNFFDRNVGKRVCMKVPIYEYNSTRNKIDCLIEQKLSIRENTMQIHKKLKSLVEYRNDFIHPKDRINLKPLSHVNIVEWLSILHQVIKKI